MPSLSSAYDLPGPAMTVASGTRLGPCEILGADALRRHAEGVIWFEREQLFPMQRGGSRMHKRPVESFVRTPPFLALAGLVIVFAAMWVPSASGQSIRLDFVQQDAIKAFDFGSGQGFQTGTVTGRINGTSFVAFQFTPSGPPVDDALAFTFQNKVIITDIDGDQLFFDNNGSGTFHLGILGATFKGSGGPLRGTYVLTGATGKYADLKIGTTLEYRAISTNPPSPPGGLGTVYAEVSRR